MAPSALTLVMWQLPLMDLNALHQEWCSGHPQAAAQDVDPFRLESRLSQGIQWEEGREVRWKLDLSVIFTL